MWKRRRNVTDLQSQLSDVSESMERILEVMALSREPNEMVFPPSTDVTLVQQQLAPGQRVLVYISTRSATFAFLLGPEKYSTWKLESPVEDQDQPGGNVARDGTVRSQSSAGTEGSDEQQVERQRGGKSCRN